jgi:hypothetical protein
MDDDVNLKGDFDLGNRASNNDENTTIEGPDPAVRSVITSTAEANPTRIFDFTAQNLRLTLDNLELVSNETPSAVLSPGTTQDGGVIAAEKNNAALTLMNVYIHGEAPDAEFGGVIAAVTKSDDSDVLIQDSDIRDGDARLEGGGVYAALTGDGGTNGHASGGTLTIERSKIGLNTVNFSGVGTDAWGGGVSSTSANTRILDSEIYNNTVTTTVDVGVHGGGIAVRDGSGPLNASSTLKVLRSSIASNTAENPVGGGVATREEQGGGIYKQGINVFNLVNSSVIGNHVGDPAPLTAITDSGGGVWASGGFNAVRYVTLDDNVDETPVAMALDGETSFDLMAPTGGMTLKGSILDSATSFNNSACGGLVTSEGGNVFRTTDPACDADPTVGDVIFNPSLGAFTNTNGTIVGGTGGFPVRAKTPAVGSVATDLVPSDQCGDSGGSDTRGPDAGRNRVGLHHAEHPAQLPAAAASRRWLGRRFRGRFGSDGPARCRTEQVQEEEVEEGP